MAEQLSCAKGHQWTRTIAPDVWPPDFRSSCPVCGEVPIGPFDMGVKAVPYIIGVAVLLIAGGAALLFVGGIAPRIGFPLIMVGGLFLTVCVVGSVMRQRMKRIAAIAGQIEFAFLPYISIESIRAVVPFQLFTLGDDQTAYNAMQGRVGDCDVLTVEYQYVVRTGPRTSRNDNSATYSYSVVILFDGAKGLPDFCLTPRTFLERLVSRADKDAVPLEDADEFTKHYHLTGSDEAGLRKIFSPSAVAYFTRERRWSVEAKSGQLKVSHSPPLKPDNIPGLVTSALEIRDLLQGKGPAPAQGPG